MPVLPINPGRRLYHQKYATEATPSEYRAVAAMIRRNRQPFRGNVA